MQKLGITTPDTEVSAWEFRAFAIIEGEISRLEDLERKRMNHGARRNH